MLHNLISKERVGRYLHDTFIYVETLSTLSTHPLFDMKFHEVKATTINYNLQKERLFSSGYLSLGCTYKDDLFCILQFILAFLS